MYQKVSSKIPQKVCKHLTAICSRRWLPKCLAPKPAPRDELGLNVLQLPMQYLYQKLCCTLYPHVQVEQHGNHENLTPRFLQVKVLQKHSLQKVHDQKAWGQHRHQKFHSWKVQCQYVCLNVWMKEVILNQAVVPRLSNPLYLQVYTVRLQSVQNSNLQQHQQNRKLEG